MFNQVHTFANEKAARDFADSMLRAYPVQGYSTLTRVYREGDEWHVSVTRAHSCD